MIISYARKFATIDGEVILIKAVLNSIGCAVMGMRHSEKLHETLVAKEELLRSEDLGDYLRMSMDDRDLSYNKYLSEGAKIQPGRRLHTRE